MPEAVIVAASRTPIGRAFKGSLSGVRPDGLALAAVQGALGQVPDLKLSALEDLYLGCGEPYDMQGGNMARRIAVQLGADELPGATITRYCASSAQAIRMAFHAIRAGEGEAFVAAGVECVSSYRDPAVAGTQAQDVRHPGFAAAAERTAGRARSGTAWTDPRATGELPDIYVTMGETAEVVADICAVDREAQDAFALRSQRRAARAIADGFYAREILPFVRSDGSVVDADDSPRPDSTAEGLAALRPAFREDGTVTAGNACPLNDGAAALVITSDRLAQRLGLTPRARILATGVSALSPEIMGLGPVEASRQALDRAGARIEDVDLVEINEAFAAQALPSAERLGVPEGRLNVHGGAIALGHPFGMTGARIAITLMNGLEATDGSLGLETMCVGGGQGMALILERLS